jgi:hypothetical protein
MFTAKNNNLNKMKIHNPTTSSKIRIGKYIVNPSTTSLENTTLSKYNWDDAVSKKIVKGVTKNNVEKLFNTLGIKPTTVEVETLPSGRASVFVSGSINGEKIIYARRESGSPMAGQTKVYSPYAVVRLLHIKDLPKEEILQALKL